MRIDGLIARLRNQQGVVLALVEFNRLAVFGVLRHVDVRSDDADRGSRDLPQIDIVVRGRAGFVAGRLAGVEGIAQSRIHIERQRVFRLACGRHLFDVGGNTPGLKRLVGVFPEDLPPVSRLLAQTLNQLLRNLPCKGLLRFRTVVAHSAPHARFVLHLHHQHRALGVGLLQVAHQRAKSGFVGFQPGRRKS